MHREINKTSSTTLINYIDQNEDEECVMHLKNEEGIKCTLH